jgi:hypothetical protein
MMDTNLDFNNKNLDINTLQTTPTPAIFILGPLFMAGVVLGSILAIVTIKTKER